MGEFVHVHFTSEEVSRGGQTTVRTLAQGRLDGLTLDVLIRNVVRSTNRGCSRVVIVKLPGEDCAIVLYTGLHFDRAGRTEVSPGKFLFATPHDLDGLAGSLGQSRGFDGCIAGVLATV